LIEDYDLAEVVTVIAEIAETGGYDEKAVSALNEAMNRLRHGG
jgi:predicted RNA methylase